MADRFDPRIADDEQARSRLLMMTNFLNLWETNDFVGALDAVTRDALNHQIGLVPDTFDALGVRVVDGAHPGLRLLG